MLLTKPNGSASAGRRDRTGAAGTLDHERCSCSTVSARFLPGSNGSVRSPPSVVCDPCYRRPNWPRPTETAVRERPSVAVRGLLSVKLCTGGKSRTFGDPRIALPHLPTRFMQCMTAFCTPLSEEAKDHELRSMRRGDTSPARACHSSHRVRSVGQPSCCSWLGARAVDLQSMQWSPDSAKATQENRRPGGACLICGWSDVCCRCDDI